MSWFFAGGISSQPTVTGAADKKAWRNGWSISVPWVPNGASPAHSFPSALFLAHLSPLLESSLPPLCRPFTLFQGQELLIYNSIGAKCFAKLLKQLKATG